MKLEPVLKLSGLSTNLNTLLFCFLSLVYKGFLHLNTKYVNIQKELWVKEMPNQF